MRELIKDKRKLYERQLQMRRVSDKNEYKRMDEMVRPALDVTVYLNDITDQIKIVASHLTSLPLHHSDISLQFASVPQFP